MTSWLKVKLGGKMRVSTAVLLIAFLGLFWVYHNVEPTPKPEPPAPAVVPPGFVPDPNYTWVPRTNVRPREPVDETTTTTMTTSVTSETTTTTTSPTETTSPTSPTSPTSTTPATTVVDPDGFGPLPPTTQTIVTPTPVSPAPVNPGPTPAATAPQS